MLFRAAGIMIFPTFHGFAEKYTFYSPELKRYAQWLKPITDRGLITTLIVIALMGGDGLLRRFFPERFPNIQMLFATTGMLGLSGSLLVHATEQFLLGNVSFGRHSQYAASAITEPAKFNAVLLSEFTMGGVMFIASIVGLCITLVKLIKQVTVFHRLNRDT